MVLAACAGVPSTQGSTDHEPDEQAEQDPLLAQARIPHVAVKEAFLTGSTPAENVDSPASWRAPDGSRWLIATAKATDRLLVYDGDSGKQLRTVSSSGTKLGELQRPNG